MLLRRIPLLTFVFSLLVTPIFAQVKATLVSLEEAIQPGKPVTVALRLEHEPHWHTYWINAGTGYPTSLDWKLPPGWTAGDIQWPTPKPIVDSHGAITGNGYEGVTYLPVTLTPPTTLKPGDSITLNARADWLMCAEVCKPGDAEVSLTLPVSDAAPALAAAHGAEVKSTLDHLPRALDAWELRATRDGDSRIKFSVTSSAASAPDLLWFFAEDGFIAYDEPQPVEKTDAHTVVLTLPISPAAEAGTQRLTGVLVAKEGWPGHPGQTGFKVDIPIGTSGSTASTTAAVSTNTGTTLGAGFAATLGLAFVGGLILNLMPCVFPVLGIKILGFVNQAGQDRRKVTMHGLVFAAGVLMSFWALATALAVLRAGGDQLGWGFQLQSAGFVFALAAVMLVFAMSMSGVFEFGLGATGIGAGLQMKEGLSGSFFTGVLATVVATPCSAPFLAPALGAALAMPIAQSFLVFTAIALGLSMPYLLLSIFPQAVKVLPRPGAWMETFKQVMAFPLYATVGYLVWVLAGQASENGLLMALFGLVLIAMAAWLYGRYVTPTAKPIRRTFGYIGTAALLVIGGWLGAPRAALPTDITWEPWSAERVAALQAEGRPIYVDFTARWCATCQANKKLVFGSDEVKQVFREKNIATLRGDWTNRDPKITAELARWNRSAVPFNLVYLPDAKDPVVLPELLTPGIVLEAVN